MSLALAMVATVASGCANRTRSGVRSPAPPCKAQCQIYALPDIAVGYAELGQMEKAEALLLQAAQVAEALVNEPDDYRPALDLKGIAVGYAEIGEYDKALSAIEVMKQVALRKDIYYGGAVLATAYQIIGIAADAQGYDQAIQWVRQLDPGTFDGVTSVSGKAEEISGIAQSAVQTLDAAQAELVLDKLVPVDELLTCYQYAAAGYRTDAFV